MKLALGTVQFGKKYGISNTKGKILDKEVLPILKFAKSKGIRMIDTAMDYGDAEKILGNKNIQNFDIITKLSRIPNSCLNSKDWIEKKVFKSLNNLNINKIYGLLMHRPDQLNSNLGFQIYKVLNNLKKKGIIKKIGISIYNPNELDKIVSKFKIDIVQAPLNILDRSLIESGWLSKLKKKHIEVHARSIFLQGLLLLEEDKLPNKFKCFGSFWKQWFVWLKKNNISAIKLCLAYIKSVKDVDYFILGINNLRHLIEICENLEKCDDILLPKFDISKKKFLNPSYW
jgi:aryl-alcohol dehydrogenase-like predicted oxidoreductase